MDVFSLKQLIDDSNIQFNGDVKICILSNLSALKLHFEDDFPGLENKMMTTIMNTLGTSQCLWPVTSPAIIDDHNLQLPSGQYIYLREYISLACELN
jgi:hypothetical protein